MSVVALGCASTTFPHDPPELDAPQIDETFVAVVSREAETAFEQQLVSAAENAPPQGREQWWHDEFDGTRVAAAVTSAALEYYLSKIKDFRHSDGSINGLRMISARLEYRATVEQTRNGYVVHLALTWQQTCGNLCGMTFKKKRTVTFSKQGDIVEIGGDGVESYFVS